MILAPQLIAIVYKEGQIMLNIFKKKDKNNDELKHVDEDVSITNEKTIDEEAVIRQEEKEVTEEIADSQVIKKCSESRTTEVTGTEDTASEVTATEDTVKEVTGTEDTASEDTGTEVTASEDLDIEGLITEENSQDDNKEETVENPQTDEKPGFFGRLVAGLTKTRNSIASGINDIFSGFSTIDDEFYEELEELLVMSDLGIRTTDRIIEDLKVKVKELKIKEPSACRELLIESMKDQMRIEDTAYDFEHQTSVVFVIGVNGVGKTTTIGKLSGKLKDQDKKVVIAAADTFRAAASDQLRVWANRAGADLISGQDGADPAAVVFDAISSAKARKADVLMIDTAGRLHNKKNLMDELAKINRVIEREFPGAYKETLVVLDATTGQNALQQAKEFNDVAHISGVVLTKMDGTAKGGIAIAIESELGIPVKYIGVGETIDDLQKFDAESFIDAMFHVSSDDFVDSNR